MNLREEILNIVQQQLDPSEENGLKYKINYYKFLIKSYDYYNNKIDDSLNSSLNWFFSAGDTEVLNALLEPKKEATKKFCGKVLEKGECVYFCRYYNYRLIFR